MYVINLETLKCPQCKGKMMCNMKNVDLVAKIEFVCEKCGSKEPPKNYIAEIDDGNIVIKPEETKWENEEKHESEWENEKKH